MRQEIEGKQIGHIKVIRKQYNPNVKCKQHDYYLVEVKGKQKLMRYDNIINFGLYITSKHSTCTKKKLTPKEIVLEKIEAKDDTALGAIMFIISLDIINTYEELKSLGVKDLHAKLHQCICEYLNTEKFNNKDVDYEIFNKSK